MENDKVKDKVNASDKEKAISKCNEVISWLDANQLAEKEEFADKQKELEAICNPIITKLYQSGEAPGSGAGPNPGGAGGAGPTIEEVD